MSISGFIEGSFGVAGGVILVPGLYYIFSGNPAFGEKDITLAALIATASNLLGIGGGIFSIPLLSAARIRLRTAIGTGSAIGLSNCDDGLPTLSLFRSKRAFPR